MRDSEAFSFIVAGPTLTFQLGERRLSVLALSIHSNTIAVCNAYSILFSFIDMQAGTNRENSSYLIHESFLSFYLLLWKMPAKPRQSSIDIHLPPGRKKFSDCLTDLILCFCFPDPRRPLFGVVMTDQGGEGGAPLGSFFRDPLPPRRALS